MLHPPDRSYSRRDTWLLVGCLGLSVTALFLPASMSQGLSALLRESVLRPLVWLQQHAEEGRTSRVRLAAVTSQRDSTAYLAQSIPALSAENQRLRQLLSLGSRLHTPYVAAEVLHQSQATDDRMLLLGAGSANGIPEFAPIVAPEGLIGVVWDVGTRSSVGMTWAHPEFRVSAFTADGRVFGMVQPSAAGDASEAVLEFRAVTYRDTVPPGTLVLSSGLGGVYPKGIPLGTVLGVEREQAGWERIYRLQPAANPSATAHVLILTGHPDSSVAHAYPSDSILAAAAADSLARSRAIDSLLRVRVADSVVRTLVRDSGFVAPRRDSTPRPTAPAPQPRSPVPQTLPAAPRPAPRQVAPPAAPPAASQPAQARPDSLR
jgi:rod shape-determining protein MreC